MATLPPIPFETRSGRSVIFRHCGIDDVDTFLEFQPQVARETTHTLQRVGNVPKAENVRAAWQASIDDRIELRIGAFDGARMVGLLTFHPLQNPPHPWNRHVATFGMMVLQEFWGEGVGRRLLELMEAHARRAEITRIEAQVRTANERGVIVGQGPQFFADGNATNHIRLAFSYCSVEDIEPGIHRLGEAIAEVAGRSSAK